MKIAGDLDVDETTGRLTATFTSLPQVQVSAINLTLRGDDAPVLTLPRTCGTFASDVIILRTVVAAPMPPAAWSSVTTTARMRTPSPRRWISPRRPRRRVPTRRSPRR